VVISVASNSAWIGLPGLAAHTAAKGGVVAMSRVLAVEGAPHGIRAVTISPGSVLTPATEQIFANSEVKKRSYDLEIQNPLQTQKLAVGGMVMNAEGLLATTRHALWRIHG
jgi:NAD(P)-dependent dehydrogenase (short-subunit alcohol dehydrogenase family)